MQIDNIEKIMQLAPYHDKGLLRGIHRHMASHLSKIYYIVYIIIYYNRFL